MDGFERMLFALDAGLRLGLALEGVRCQALTVDSDPAPTRAGQIERARDELGRTLESLDPFVRDRAPWEQEAAATLRDLHGRSARLDPMERAETLRRLGRVMYAWMDNGDVGALARDIRAVWPDRP